MIVLVGNSSNYEMSHLQLLHLRGSAKTLGGWLQPQADSKGNRDDSQTDIVLHHRLSINNVLDAITLDRVQVSVSSSRIFHPT